MNETKLTRVRRPIGPDAPPDARTSFFLQDETGKDVGGPYYTKVDCEAARPGLEPHLSHSQQFEGHQNIGGRPPSSQPYGSQRGGSPPPTGPYPQMEPQGHESQDPESPFLNPRYSAQYSSAHEPQGPDYSNDPRDGANRGDLEPPAEDTRGRSRRKPSDG